MIWHLIVISWVTVAPIYTRTYDMTIRCAPRNGAYGWAYGWACGWVAGMVMIVIMNRQVHMGCAIYWDRVEKMKI